MKKSERLKTKRKINYKCFLLANVLTLFFALAPASPSGGPIASAEGNFFDFNQESPYSEPFSKLIDFLNEKKNELAKKQNVFLNKNKENLFEIVKISEKSDTKNKIITPAGQRLINEAEFNLTYSSFTSAVFESVKSFVVDRPKIYLGTIMDSAKSFVFPGDSQNDFEYNSPTSLSAKEAGESAAREMENLKQQYAEAIEEAKSASQKFNLLQTEMEKIKNSGVVVREPVIEQRVVERTIEKIVSGLSQADLDSNIFSIRNELNNLNTNLTNQLNNLSAQTSRQNSATYQAVSLTNKIDSLTNTTITTPTISNPTITGTLTNQTLSNSGNATISGALSVSGLATFANSTTTNATIADNFWSNGSTYIGDADADILTIRAGVWSLTSAATSTVAMTNGLNFDSNTLVIDPNSNRVGIGTSSPYRTLSIAGNAVVTDNLTSSYFTATSTTATSTFSGQTVAGFAPTLAHSFGSWSVGAAGANPLGASFIINPSSAASDSNLLSLSVNGSAKFLVDAEGDVFANAVTVVGGTTLSTTTASTFTVENNTNLGDATTTDITYFNSRIADSLIPTADNLLDLGDSANWLRWRTGYFGTSVGIGGTATSTGTQLTTSGAYLIDSGNTLSINTTNNKAVSFGTGNVVLPYGSSTALTVSGSAYIGSLNGPLQANNGLVSATTSVGSIYGGTGINSSALTGIAQIVAGTWSASSTLSTTFGGTGWGNLQANTVLLGNGAGRIATTSAGTDGYVLGLSAGVPTWLATSTLSTITGTLAVGKGGTGQTSFGQGWLNSNGTDLSASTSPTVNYIVATSTTATSTFPYLSITTNSNLGTVVGGTWQGTAITPTYGGTGQNFSASSGLVNFYSGTASAIATSSLGLLTTNVAEGTNLYWTNDRFDTRLSATTTLPNLTTLLGLTNATTTGITSTNSWLGTIRSGTWNGTAISNQYGGTGLDSSALTGIAQIVAGTWSASSTLSTAFGGTGWGNLQANTVLLGNGAGRISTTTAGTDGYVLGLSAGVPTWLATSTLSTITGTLAVAKGGTGQTSFGQGWLNSDGTTLSASTSPTVNYIVATSTTATSTFPYLSVTTNSNLGTVVGGTWQGAAIGAAYGGTGQNFSASSGLVNFYSGTASAIATSSLGLLTTNVAEGTNLYWTNDRFDTRLSATTTLPNITTLLGLTNATTTGITSTNSWLGTIRSGTWNGTAISNQYGGTGLDSSALTGIAQIVAGTWSASSTLSTAFGGTGWGNLQANTILLGNGAGRLATTSAGTDGYVLALSAGVPTWLATSTLSTITGTLAVAKGGTGATTLTGLLQGNGTSAITGIAGTAGQFPYYNGTDTLLATSSLFLATSGNVGIGTTTPDSKLTVFNNAADSAIEFSSASGSTYKWTMGLDYSDAGKFKIASSTALGSIDRFTIDGKGYVGIGTSTPARRLDVADSGNNNAQMRLSRETDIYTDFSVAQTTGDLSLSLYGTNADDISLYMPDGSTGANLWVCEGAACPNGISFTGGGNLFVEGVIKYATSTTPKTRRSIILTAPGAIVPATSGAAKTQVDGTNHSYYVLDFDASSDEAAFWQWTMPDSYDNGSIDVTYYWEAGATSGDTILCFQAKGLSANSSEDIDSALSSAVCETDTAQANANDLASITETNATSNFTAGEYVTFKVFRDADAGGDTMTGDARLVKVKLEYGVSAESD